MISCDPTDFPETAGDVAGRAMLVRATRPDPARVRRARLPVRRRLERVPGAGHGRRASRCPPGLRQAEQLPEPLFTPTTKAESGHDLPLTADEAVELVGRRRVRAAARPLAAALRARRRARRERGLDARRHEVRVRRARRRDHRDRRDDDARLVAVLAARGVPRRRPRRRRSTSSTCATSWTAPAGITSRPRRACRPR